MNERIDQTGEDIKITLTGNSSPKDGQTYYVGQYASNPNIVGKVLETNPAGMWTDAPMTITDPDHIKDVRTGLIFVRTSEPKPDDAPCDADNSSHTQADYAFQRGKFSLNNGGASAKAECWFHAAAVQGHAKSQGILGMMLHDGAPGVQQDYAGAFMWLKKGAEAGDYYSQIALANVYRLGHGTAADTKMFDFWTAKANSSASVAVPVAKPCDPSNPPKIEAQEAFLNGERIWKAKTDDRSAVCWYRVAALQGHAAAQARLGKAYLLGLGVPKDYSQAFEWAKKSAAQGDWDGEMQMAFAYEQGAGVPYDFKVAQEWHAKARVHEPKEATAAADRLNRQIGQASGQILMGAAGLAFGAEIIDDIGKQSWQLKGYQSAKECESREGGTDPVTHQQLHPNCGD